MDSVTLTVGASDGKMDSRVTKRLHTEPLNDFQHIVILSDYNISPFLVLLEKFGFDNISGMSGV